MRMMLGGAVVLAACAMPTSALAQTRTAQPAAAEPGRVIAGELTGDENRHPLRLAAGQTVRITARGRDFDAQLKVYGPTGTEPLAEDDDSGGGTTADLTFQAPRAGTYQVAVSESGTAEHPGSGRGYDLSVLPAVAPVASPARAITPNGAEPIAVDTAQCGTGCRFTFQANEGDRLIAETSGAGEHVDPVLELRAGAEKIAEDDDGGEGLNARLVRRIPRTGTYTLVARTVNGTGAYALAVSLRPHVARAPAPLAVGAPLSGRIGADAEMTDEGKAYDAYTLHGRAGQRVALDLSSTDFDAELIVYGDSVLGPVQLAMNDDADTEPHGRPRTLDSHLVLTFARDGDVEVRAVSLNHPGAYTLRASNAPAR